MNNLVPPPSSTPAALAVSVPIQLQPSAFLIPLLSFALENMSDKSVVRLDKTTANVDFASVVVPSKVVLEFAKKLEDDTSSATTQEKEEKGGGGRDPFWVGLKATTRNGKVHPDRTNNAPSSPPAVGDGEGNDDHQPKPPLLVAAAAAAGSESPPFSSAPTSDLESKLRGLRTSSRRGAGGEVHRSRRSGGERFHRESPFFAASSPSSSFLSSIFGLSPSPLLADDDHRGGARAPLLLCVVCRARVHAPPPCCGTSSPTCRPICSCSMTTPTVAARMAAAAPPSKTTSSSCRRC